MKVEERGHSEPFFFLFGVSGVWEGRNQTGTNPLKTPKLNAAQNAHARRSRGEDNKIVAWSFCAPPKQIILHDLTLYLVSNYFTLPFMNRLSMFHAQYLHDLPRGFHKPAIDVRRVRILHPY